MDLLINNLQNLFTVLQSLVSFALVIGILVFVHEYGHYFAGRYYGVKVETFAIGMGKELFGYTDKHGTRWKLCIFPIGGYVKFSGDADAASSPDMQKLSEMTAAEKERSFFYKPAYQRIIISASGPLANYLFAIILMAGVYSIAGKRYMSPVVDHVESESAAAIAGIQVGDRILKINQHNIDSLEQVRQVLNQGEIKENEAVQVLVSRSRSKSENAPTNSEEGATIRNSAEQKASMGVQTLDLAVTPKVTTRADIFGNVHSILTLGVASSRVEYLQYNPISAVFSAVGDVVSISGMTLKAIGEMIIGIRGTDEMGGPIRIAEMSGKVAQTGNIVAIIWLLVLLSVNLGLINLLPIPMLDGGHIMFYLLEIIGGKPLSQRVQNAGFAIGLGIIGSLMIFATYKDILRVMKGCFNF